MADPRLQWRNVNAPDFSSTSNILANASRTLDSGLSNASDLLKTYQEGRQAVGDQSILADIAGIKSEEELGAYLTSGALEGRNLSPDMQKTVLGLRDQVIGYGQGRANVASTEAGTKNTLGRLAIAQAAEGRTAAEYQDGVEVRDARRALTPLAIAARREGNTQGRPNPSTYIKYSNSNATRNKPINDNLAQSMGFLGDMGVTMNVISGGQDAKGEGTRRTGSTRHDHGNAADVDFYVGDRKLDWNNQADLPVLKEIVARARANGVTGIGAGDDYMGAGRFHIGFGSEATWGAGGKGENAPSWLNEAVANAGHYAGDGHNHGGGQPVTVNGEGAAYSALADAIAANPNVGTEFGMGLLDQAMKSQTVGQGQIDERQAAQIQEQSAASILSAIQDPNNLNQGDVQRAVVEDLQNQGLSAEDTLSGATRSGKAAEALQSVLAPQAEVPGVVADTVANAVNASERQLEANPQTILFNEAQEFESDPTGSVKAAIKGIDGVEAEYSDRDVDVFIRSQAEKLGVTPGVVASAMNNIAKPLPEGGILGRAFLPDATIENRFPEEELASFVESNFSEAARNQYESSRLVNRQRTGEIKAQESDIKRDLTRAQKLPQGSAERAQIERAAEEKASQVLRGITQTEAQNRLKQHLQQSGMASRLRNVEQGSEEFNRVVRQIEADILGDPGITETEKELLIQTLRG